MRHLALLLCAALACAALAFAEGASDVQSFLTGRNQRYPQLSDPKSRAVALPLIAEALRGHIEVRERAWGLLSNLGPEAAPILDDVLRSFLLVPAGERHYAMASGLASLGPLAEPLLPAILAAPDHLGLDWSEILRLCRDPAGLVPRLVDEAGSKDRATARAAAEGLRSIAWCPAVAAAAPELERALARWPTAPPLGPKKECVAVSWMAERNDPDDTIIFARRVTHDTLPDPWPTLLLVLAEAAPGSADTGRAALAHLTADADPERRQAALQALARLTPADPDALALAMVPWLGPGPRGRYALTVLLELGPVGRVVLEELPHATRDLVIAQYQNHAFDHATTLPEGWVEPLVAATGRPCIGYTRLVACCGRAGATHLLAMPDADTARFSIDARQLPPTEEPAGLAEALAGPDTDHQAVAQAMLEAWWYAPWALTLAARHAVPEALDLHLAGLAAANGDAPAAAWLRADPARMRRLAEEPPWQLRLHPELLPADLAAVLAPNIARSRAHIQAVIAAHPPDCLVNLPADPGQAEALLLARMRRESGESIPLFFLRRGTYVAEASAVLARSLAWQPINQVAGTMAMEGARLPQSARARYLAHPDPLVRRMAAGW